MEVFVKMEGTRPGSGKSNTLMLGRFSMVCRDSHTHKARRVPPLIVETEEEQLLWEIGEQHKEKRTEFSKRTLDKQPVSTCSGSRGEDSGLEDAGPRCEAEDVCGSDQRTRGQEHAELW